MRAVVVTKQGNPVTPNIRFQTDWSDLPAPTAGWVGNPSLKTVINGRAVLAERVGANYPLLSSTNGITNQ